VVAIGCANASLARAQARTRVVGHFTVRLLLGHHVSGASVAYRAADSGRRRARFAARIVAVAATCTEDADATAARISAIQDIFMRAS
jgi:hypothetical protein